MSGDTTKTQTQDGGEFQRARDLSLRPDGPQPPGVAAGYDPVRRLGQGAYGEVWLAVNRSNPGQQVAIKFYTHRGSDWSLLSREVEKLNFLATDTHVVQLLDVGAAATPPYYVMQFFENGSLGKWLEGARLGVADAVALFREIVVALVQAHNKGVLHCDLKPDNVLLDKDFKPRLADFGQSRLAGETAPTLGTLFYMPPEQADLAAAPDTRWDVYALGAILYTMLTGSAPYRTPEAETFIREAPDLPRQLEHYRQVLLTSPRPRAHHRVPGIDRRLIDFLDRCLATDPERRFANAQAVLDALDDRAMARARRPVFWLTAAAGLLMLLGLGAFAAVMFQTSIEHSQRTLTDRVLEGNRFAAQFGAATAAREIELRWQALQVLADDEEFASRVRRAAAEDDTDGFAHKELAKHLDDAMKGLARALGRGPDSLFVTDAWGEQLARSPASARKTVGLQYAHRDYFHGLGGDLPRGTRGTVPIADVHLSIVYKGEADGKPRISFTVPVWSDGPLPTWFRQVSAGLALPGLGPVPAPTLLGLPDGTPADPRWPWLGVLGMSVEPGHFIELQPPNGRGEQVAVLIDSRPDQFDPRSPKERGLILQHPELDAYLAAAGDQLPKRFADLELLDELTQCRPGAPAARQLLRDWRDPFEDDGDNRWLAALAPVVVSGHPPEVAQTRWLVMVQQREAAALAPVDDLRSQLLLRGLLTFGVLGVALGGLVLFLAWALNESGRSPLHRFLRRRAGLDPLSSGKPTPLLPLTIKVPVKTLPASR